MPTRETNPTSFTRRDMLKFSAAAGAALLVPELIKSPVHAQEPEFVPPPEFTKDHRALPIRRIETDQPYVSLTLDDGYFPKEVEKFLRIAEKLQLKFTLFPIGAVLRNDPDTWRAVKAAGHEIGNHSQWHGDASHMSKKAIDRNFRMFEEETYPSVFGEPFPAGGYARVPLAQGPVNRNVQEVIFDLEDLHVHWRVDSYSWKRLGSDPKFLLNNVSKAEAGDIVVLHLIDRDLDLLPAYVDALSKKGLTSVPFSKLWEARKPQEPEPQKTSRRSFLFATLPERAKTVEAVSRPDIVFGAYVPYHMLRLPYMEKFKEYILRNGVNTIIIDVKNEAGRINIPFNHPLNPNTKPTYMDDPKNVSSLLDWANAHNIYMIGRQVVMPDNRFCNAHPEYALQDGFGKVWLGAGRPWMNPFLQEVADYQAALARAISDFGIKEALLDYVRFPDRNLEYIKFSGPYTREGRVNATTNIVKTIHERLADTSTLLGVSFFGYTAWYYHKDMGIGQSIEAVAPYINNLAPMAYPDLYGTGIVDCKNMCKPAPLYPREIVYYTVAHAKERLNKINPTAMVTPWIQAYENIKHRNVTFSPKDIDKQAKGAFAAGADGVMAWNTSAIYPETMYPDAEDADGNGTLPAYPEELFT